MSCELAYVLLLAVQAISHSGTGTGESQTQRTGVSKQENRSEI